MRSVVSCQRVQQKIQVRSRVIATQRRQMLSEAQQQGYMIAQARVGF